MIDNSLDYLDFEVDSEPLSLLDALADPRWLAAMQEALSSIEENKTWTLTELPFGKRPIFALWVFKIKPSSTDTGPRYKARLVARGYKQQVGLDYDQIFAPLANGKPFGLSLPLQPREDGYCITST